MSSNIKKTVVRFSRQVLRLFQYMNDGNTKAILRHKDSHWIALIWQR